ncbi:hypothetical protein AVEN_50523-1 [Araneus ventricosus]|uniref:Uncharacterized protein n=1 Tax=Araneus ventricosus TaxID=182803 RepID=A0A4Y2ARX1_ARAVE|nr:hypothetical protein AVEN_50523-1 [Araneus ventricosus]
MGLASPKGSLGLNTAHCNRNPARLVTSLQTFESGDVHAGTARRTLPSDMVLADFVQNLTDICKIGDKVHPPGVFKLSCGHVHGLAQKLFLGRFL